jgi:hypothetical protein
MFLGYNTYVLKEQPQWCSLCEPTHKNQDEENSKHAGLAHEIGFTMAPP